MTNYKKKHHPNKSHGCHICNKDINLRQKARGAKQESNHTAAKLLDYIENSPDFPDYELADAIEEASNEFRKNFKLRNYKL